MNNSSSCLNNQDRAPFASHEGEISLQDILRFLKSAWKSIAITGALGLAAAVIYLLVTPKQFEATFQITMAQIGTANNNNDNNLNPLGINIEDPALLIARFSSPTSLSPQAIEACGLQNQVNAALTLSGMIKLTIPKGVANVVELKILGPSPQSAQACAQSLFDLIKDTQAQLVAPYVEGVKARLADDEERLQNAKDLLAKADKSGAAIGAAYLSTRDETRYLLDEIAALNRLISITQNRATRLLAPIYASETPAHPKKQMALAAGLLGGLFLGLLVALGRQMIAIYKREMAGAA